MAEGLPTQSHEWRQAARRNPDSNKAKLARLLVFAGLAVGAAAAGYLGTERKTNAENTPEPQATQQYSGESLYYAQAQEAAKKQGVLLLTHPTYFRVDESQLGAQANEAGDFSRAIPQGTVLLEAGIRRLVIDYDNNRFQDGLVTFINQNDQEPYIPGQHLNRIYSLRPEENFDIQLRQFTYLPGGANQEVIPYTLEAGKEYAFIPIVVPNPGHTIAYDTYRDPVTGGIAMHDSGDPRGGNPQTFLTIEENARTQSNLGGIELAVFEVAPFDPSTGQQVLSLQGVMGVSYGSIRELRDGSGVGIERVDYSAETTNN